MWQILCNGERLDLLTSWQPSFSRKNNAFSFGSIEMSRSLSFTIPSSPKNDRVFAVGNDYHNGGERVRQHHEAWLFGDTVSFSGSLYITDADRSGYKCVFVFGELEALKALSEVKKLNYDNCGVDEQMRPIVQGISRPLNNAVVCTVNDSQNYAFVNRQYNNHTSTLTTSFHVPSVKVSKLFENLQTKFGLSVQMPNECADLCVVLDGVKGQTDRSVTLSKSGINAATITASEVMKISSRYADITYYNGQGQQSKSFKWFEVVEDCEVTFPDNFPDDVFLCDGYETPTFYGGFSFNTGNNVAVRNNLGRPLTGRKIKLSANDEQGAPIRYGFFKKGLYQNSGSGASRIQGFQQGQDASHYSYTLVVSSTYDATAERNITTPHNYWLRDNYPSCGYMDLLNTIAALSGKYIYLEGNTIKFVGYDIDHWTMLRLDKVMSIQTVERKFSDFGQKGIITYDRADYVSDARNAEYHVDNTTLSAEKTIYKVPFNDGDGTKSNTESLFIDDFSQEIKEDGTKEVKFSNDKQTIAHIGSDSQLTRTALPVIADISHLCEVSTSVEATISMTAYDFSRLKENSLIWLGGSLWVWLDASWSKNVARLSLAKWK